MFCYENNSKSQDNTIRTTNELLFICNNECLLEQISKDLEYQQSVNKDVFNRRTSKVSGAIVSMDYITLNTVYVNGCSIDGYHKNLEKKRNEFVAETELKMSKLKGSYNASNGIEKDNTEKVNIKFCCYDKNKTIQDSKVVLDKSFDNIDEACNSFDNTLNEFKELCNSFTQQCREKLSELPTSQQPLFNFDMNDSKINNHKTISYNDSNIKNHKTIRNNDLKVNNNRKISNNNSKIKNNRMIRNDGLNKMDNKKNCNNNDLNIIDNKTICNNNELNTIDNDDKPTDNKLNVIDNDDKPTNNKLNTIDNNDKPTNDKLNTIDNDNNPTNDKLNTIDNDNNPTNDNKPICKNTYTLTFLTTNNYIDDYKNIKSIDNPYDFITNSVKSNQYSKTSKYKFTI